MWGKPRRRTLAVRDASRQSHHLSLRRDDFGIQPFVAAFLVAILLVLAANAGQSAAASPRHQTIIPANRQVFRAASLAKFSGPLPINLSASEFSVTKSVGIQINVATPGRARCRLRVTSKNASLRFPTLLTGSGKKGAWRWLAADQAPTGKWRFAVSCRKGSSRGRAAYEAFIFTPNRSRARGRLLERSTAAIPVGHLATQPRVRRSHRASARTSAANTYPVGQCTWYVKQRRPDIPNYLGNAGGWVAAAQRRGFPTGTVPVAGAVAVWRPYFAGAGGYGHVAYVERVISGGRILISESNWGYPPLRTGSRVIASAGLGFIYGGPAGNGRPAPPAPPPFGASLDGQFPMDSNAQVYVTTGGAAVSVGYNVRFNQGFRVTDFVLRPTTPTTVDRFSSIAGDFPGAVAPNDSHVGYFRTSVRAPADTPPGTYFMQWNTVNVATGQVAALQPSLKLVVSPPVVAPSGQPCPVPAPGGPFTLTPDPSFTASLDAQFAAGAQGKVFAALGEIIPFGFNVRFNQPFSAQNFSLRTDTPGTINFFSTAKGDWRGFQAPNDGHVGYYRANLVVPTCTPPGQYPVKWNVINLATGKWALLQPSFTLAVEPVPLAVFLSPADEQLVPPGGSRSITISVQNNGHTPFVRGQDNLHAVDSRGRDIVYPYCGKVSEWVSGTAVLMKESAVPPRGTATYEVRICGKAGYEGPATLRLQYVREGVAHFNPVFALGLRFGTPPAGPGQLLPSTTEPSSCGKAKSYARNARRALRRARAKLRRANSHSRRSKYRKLLRKRSRQLRSARQIVNNVC
jgi:surface antigen